MLRCVCVLVCLTLAAPVAAKELSEAQQVAFDVVLPPVTEALTAQGGEALAVHAPALAECVVKTAKRKELPVLSVEEIGEAETALLNDLMLRPKTQRCLTKALQ